METNPIPQTEKKNNQKTIIWVVVAVLLCCCCVAAGVAGWYGYQAYLTAQQVVEDVQDFEIPTDIPNLDPSGEIPSGGLADAETRALAWASVQVVGLMSGCNMPTAEGTTINVTQQPDASGEWREDWNVNCGDGTFKTFPLTFTSQGGVINVTVGVP